MKGCYHDEVHESGTAKKKEEEQSRLAAAHAGPGNKRQRWHWSAAVPDQTRPGP
ncbi:predicted protein [Plenodomus lingam JN3]|uniref:Predicted protein n=1 Tax=Leptosphaeria maculans (strain JN3 / isolate v23.1.3 / race Av1-4-5-6-7-8) TaxID=985895 RepID=E4ZQ04_LEPMJ|nr:predicted protein [Plenodomus lingam JN3]CBX93539.1 predicted protein [Plenodomus lingam JN3]